MSLSRRQFVGIGIGGIAAIAVGYTLVHQPYPPDTTPEGAYMRIAKSVTEDDPKAFFAYLEQEAQWACYTLRDMRRKARGLVVASYPEPQKSELATQYGPLADAPDGSDVFTHLYRSRGWARRLRKDLSGIDHVESEGERASIVTVGGTRWPFRRRENGIWGMTIFTADLLADAEKATRDLAVVEAAAKDYERVKSGR